MTIPQQQNEPSEPPVTCNQASMRYGPGTHDARERYEELSMREHLSRAYAKLKASREYDPAKHGTGDTEPLTAADHLELLATAEYLARAYKPHGEVDHVLRAGATWEQVADVLGTDDAAARAEYRSWAAGQHDMWASTGIWAGEPAHRFGMNDAEYAEVLARAAATEMYPGGIGNPDSIGIQTADRIAGAEPEAGA
jgi:hypothetical protein